MQAWAQEMREEHWPWLVVGCAALLPGALFLGSVLLIDYGGLGQLEPWREAIMGAGRSPWWGQAIDGLIVFGPVAALLLVLTPWLRQGRVLTASGRAEMIQSRVGRLSLILAMVGLAMTLVFATYLIAENWPCLVGQRISC